MLLPSEAQPLLAAILPHFTQPTSTRFVVLLAATILTTGRRTVANLLRTLGELASGHDSSYRRVLSSAQWSGLELGCALARFLLDHRIPDGPVALVGDDTVDGHSGRTVQGKGRHRDAVRSSHSFTAWRYGHKWVVLAILVRFPFANRRWALPVLVDLYRTPEVSRAEGVRHRTPAQLMCRLLRLVLLRFPDRTFVFAGDSGFGTHEVTRFCHRHRQRLILVSQCHPDVNLFTPPPPYRGNGRPRVKGDRLPKPRVAVTTRPRQTFQVDWYGGGTRRIETVTGTGHWYKAGAGLVPIRWVFVKDRTGTHRDEYLFTTDTTMTVETVVNTYCGRWSIETTFQECRSCVGLETTRGRCQTTVSRAAPCLFGLYSVVAVLYHLLPEDKRSGAVEWAGKETVTFSDALTAVRRWIWSEGVFREAKIDAEIAKLPANVRELLLSGLAPAP
jgi:hypothetical protein